MSLRNRLLLATAFACVAAPALAQDKSVAATVNGKPIYEEQVTQTMAQVTREGAGGPNRSQVIQELVNEELVYQDALKQKLDKNKEVQQDLEQMRRRVLMTSAVKAALSKNPVTEDQLKAEYEKIKKQMDGKEYKARHILVDSKEKAEDVIKQLDGGGKFAELASKYSTDPGSKNGGDLGWFPADKMVPPFAAAVRALQKGEYTRSPVQTQFGWHVILLEDSREMPAPAFADVKERLRAMLQQQRVAEYLKGLHAKAKVDVKKP